MKKKGRGNGRMGSEMKSLTDAGGQKLIERMVDPVVRYVGKIYRNAQVDLGTVYTSYLEKAYRRYNQKTTLATGYQPRCIIGGNNIYVGDNITLAINPNKIHCFDRDTENVIFN